METSALLGCLKAINSDFFVGVPDSQLESLCNYLTNENSLKLSYLVAANEGNAVGIAAGHFMATGKYPCVFMQNSGLGNALNPIASLLNTKVYGIPVIFIIGWRGEPGLKDEPQHLFQGEITIPLLEILGIQNFIIDKHTKIPDLKAAVESFVPLLKAGHSVALVVKKNALEGSQKTVNLNPYSLMRERVLEILLEFANEDVIISTTGKTSREIFEIRERRGQSHATDFLTVGSMGHSSSIAFGAAMFSSKRIWCVDGDGAGLMHMGAMAIIGAHSLKNLVHVMLNNSAHESVGGMPTVADRIDFCKIAGACGYCKTYSVDNQQDLNCVLQKITNESGPIFLEIKISVGSRSDLGRPTISSQENLANFLEFFRQSS